MVTTLSVTDGDQPNTPAWNAKFKIVSGDPGGLFNVTTGTNKQQGIITTVKVGSKAEVEKLWHFAVNCCSLKYVECIWGKSM